MLLHPASAGAGASLPSTESCGLQRHERPLVLNRKRERIVQPSRAHCELRVGWNNQHLDPGRTQSRQALPANQRIRIEGRHNAARDPRSDQRVRARSGAAMMNAGLQRDARSRAVQVMPRGARLLQRGDLRVVEVVIEMRALTENSPGLRLQKDTANSWIGRCEGASVAWRALARVVVHVHPPAGDA